MREHEGVTTHRGRRSRNGRQNNEGYKGEANPEHIRPRRAQAWCGLRPGCFGSGATKDQECAVLT